MLRGDQKMMLKRVLVTAFACFFVMAFGLGQVAYGVDDGVYEGTIKIKGNIRDVNEKADDFKFKIKDQEAVFEVDSSYKENITGEFQSKDGNFTCKGLIGERAFWLKCDNVGSSVGDIGLCIDLTGKVKETKKGELKFKGKALTYSLEDQQAAEGTGRGEMTGKLSPVVWVP